MYTFRYWMAKRALVVCSSWTVAVCTIALIWFAGCRSMREYPAVPAQLRESGALRTERPAEDPIQLVDGYPGSDERSDSPREILVLSGGGSNGAFTAGMLVGWSKAGSRPEFDIITGVSTGALIAPLAFIGPEYDEELKRLYTSKDSTNIYTLLPPLPGATSLASSKPLEKKIQTVINEELLERIAKEHLKGRRLYVGTTNLDTQKPVVWDIGAIAIRKDAGNVEMIQKIILASCSVPGLLPPVAINVEINSKRYSELHVDGGVSASMFLPPQVLGLTSQQGLIPASASNKRVPETTVYTIVAGKADPDPVEVKSGLLNLSNASLAGMLRAQQEHELERIYLLTYFAKARFQLAAIPAHVVTPPSVLEFDIDSMKELFEHGWQLGASDQGWLDSPPGVDPNHWPTPRNGLRLVSETPQLR